MKNTLIINSYCDVATGHWKLHYFSNTSIYLTEEYMTFLDVEEWDSLDVIDNEDGTLTLKGNPIMNKHKAKRRNPVAKYARRFNKARTFKDRKKAFKSGYFKYKKER